MVFLERQQSCPSSFTQRTTLTRRSSSVLPMGNEETTINYDNNHAPPPTRNRNSSKHIQHLNITWSRWMLPLVYFVALISFTGSMRSRNQFSSLLSTLESELANAISRHEETAQIVQEANATKLEAIDKYVLLKKTKDRLLHELLVTEELQELEASKEYKDYIIPKMAVRRQEASMVWIEQRQEALSHKVKSLEAYIQEQSRQQVLEKYGKGPHRVEFQVQIEHNPKRGKFMVELAPVNVMPHAVENFLDMISSNLWDNTVFYHHSSQHHVIAAAPVQHGTFESKQHHFDVLENGAGMSFPEYSELFPHKEYTLGFTGKGPNFYINTISNAEHHGPGGQGHHELTSDADPCFGKIVWGKNIIQDMMPIRSRVAKPVSWSDFDVSKIVQVRLLR